MRRRKMLMKLYAISFVKSAVMLALIVVGGLALGAGLSQVVRAAEVEGAVTSQTAAEDVKRWLKETKSLTADFTQQGADGQLVRGTFTLQQPGQMRFDYEPSVEMLIVADNGSLYFIDYEVRQLSRYPIKQTPLAPLLRLDGIDALELEALEMEGGPMAGTIAVTSRDPKHREYGTLTMIFGRDMESQKLNLRAWTVLDGQGNLTQITLNNIAENIVVADNAFDFKDPRKRGPRKR